MRTATRRVTLLKLARQEERRLTNIQNKAQAERIRLKWKIVTNITRRRTLDAVMDWKKREEMLGTMRNKRLREIKQQKQWIIEKKYVCVCVCKICIYFYVHAHIHIYNV